jgi:hypothetical protein
MPSKKKKNGGNLTTEILVQIRDEMRATRLELRDEIRALREEHSASLSELNDHVDQLERRQTEDAVRLSTEVVALASAVREVRDLLRDQHIERERLEDHERRLRALEKRSP